MSWKGVASVEHSTGTGRTCSLTNAMFDGSQLTQEKVSSRQQ